MDTTSLWLQHTTLPRFPTLEDNLTVDVLVVGAGLTGITAACLLKQAGLTVALVERERCGGVDTGHTTAHLTAVTDLRLQDLKHRFNAKAARAVWEGGMAAIDRIAGLAQSHAKAAGFKWCPGFLHATATNAAPKLFEREAEVARQLGIVAEFQPTVPIFQAPGVLFPRQALFNPLAYLDGLVRTVPGAGCHVFENTDAHEIEKDRRRMRTKKGRISFSHIVLATHNPLTGLCGTLGAALLQTKLSLYTSYALGARLPAGRLPEGLFWDTRDPYDYLRVEHVRGEAHVIFGGEDHKTGQASDTAERFDRLEQRLRVFAPEAAVDARWSGQVIETNDGLPFIGETADRQFIATGFSGNGMTFGTLGAMMAVDAIVGRSNPWQKLLDPHRKKLRGGTWTYLKENKDYPYHVIRDRLVKPQARSLRDLAPGEGKVVQLKKRKVAAYRDPQGRVTLCSAVCTHLQGIVGWNPAEKTWDCPCHGARFHPDGRVMAGPAEEPLARLSPATGLPIRPRRTAVAR